MDIRSISIKDIGLSVRSSNCLYRADITTVGEMLDTPEESFSNIRNLGKKSLNEILNKISELKRISTTDLSNGSSEKLESNLNSEVEQVEMSIYDLMRFQKYHDDILQYVKANDSDIEMTDLSARARGSLIHSGFNKISDFLFLTPLEIGELRNAGSKTVNEITAFKAHYLEKHSARIFAYCKGDTDSIWDKTFVRESILEIYNTIGFKGLSYKELRERAELSGNISDDLLMNVIGDLLANKELEYVDYRCYRIYTSFMEYLTGDLSVSERNRRCIIRRLQGETLENIAVSYGMTRERVRQIISKYMEDSKANYRVQTGMKWFDEDYYRYFSETYSFEKMDAANWLGIDQVTFQYLELTGARTGTGKLEDAVNDRNLDYGLRLKIQNYLNRNKLYLNGQWIERKRSSIEEYVVREFCKENTYYNEFCVIYNNFLQSEEIPYDEDIYYTESVLRTRKNRLSDARFLLWKLNEQIRYYDIDGRDYSELLDTININAYENIEYSTAKFMTDYPAVMKKYDIRDQYELHNLLRKVVPEGSYHDFHCKRMPVVGFGKFDRDMAILELLIENAPISQADFAELIRQEYGHDPATSIGTHFQSLSPYFHQGMYSIDQKVMSYENRKKLEANLTDDFYYIEEIRRIYETVCPESDKEDINPYNLKAMGFVVLSRYVYRNHTSLDDYFRYLLTKEDITDITAYRKRFAYVQAFSFTLISLKIEREVFEFDKNQIIHIRKLVAAGVTSETIQIFCDQVWNFVEEGSYFSVSSIKLSGFYTELFELGFSDWFYASILASDDRFVYSNMFSNIILCKRKEQITIKTFEVSLIEERGSIDVYDLMTELEKKYGCKVSEKHDLIYKVYGTNVYYDEYLDRLYASKSLFDRELYEMEGN